MKMKSLASVFSRALNNVPGQAVAIFPEGLGQEFLLDVANFMNQIDSSQHVRALVMHESRLGATEQTPVVNERSLVSYRLVDEGNRLVVANRPFLFDSNNNVFKPVLFEGFPDGSDGPVTLENLADSLILELGLVESEVGLTATVKECLEVLSRLYSQDSEAFTESWTLHWFQHVAEGLNNASSWLAEASQHESLSAEQMQGFFGLPSRQDSSISLDKLGNAYDRAVKDWWSSEEAALDSSGFIDTRRVDGNSTSDLSKCDFGTLPDHKNLSSGFSIYFFRWLSACALDKEGFKLTERDFLSPRYSGKSTPLRLLHRGKTLGIKGNGIVEKGPYFAPLTESGDGLWAFELEARVRLRKPLESSEITDEDFKLSPRSSDLEWSTKKVTVHGEELRISGSLFVSGDIVVANILDSPLLTYLDLRISSRGTLVDAVPAHLSCQLLVVADEPNQVIFFDAKPRTTTVTRHETLTGNITVDNDFDSLTILTSAKHPKIDSKDLRATEIGPWAIYTVSSPEHLELTSDDGTLTFIRKSAGSNRQSPLIAAAFGEELAVSNAKSQNTRSARGLFEDYLSRHAEDESHLQANFHFLVGEDSKFPEGSSTEYLSGFITEQSTYQVFQGQEPMEVDPDFLSAPEVEGFRQAYRDLGIPALMNMREGYDSEWPSRVSWRELFTNKRELLDSYLSNYKSMVDLARRTFGSTEIFWASYPFSFSVWDLSAERVECKAVLLSPLHPIRLSWLASVEATLWGSPDASLFLGAVEGWNLPYFGPSPVEYADSMVAVPTDNGDGQLFLGWSMLVSLQSQNFSTPKSPPRIVGQLGLGTSPTGFNAATAHSALASFENLFPQHASIVIDLSAQFPGPRLQDVDEAVVKTMKLWSKQTDYYPGGVHVLDSTSRLGQPPFDAISDLIDQSPALKLSWKRYAHDKTKVPRSNLRLLQDPGVQMKVTRGGDEHGVLDAVPIKRFITRHEVESRGTSTTINPTVSDGSGWREFSSALRACEDSTSGPALQAALNRPQIADGKADWTITGEGMISPSVISKLLSAGKKTAGKQMLWEWRPPIAGRSGDQINEKPFMTVARVPASLPAQINNILSRAGLGSTDANADDILQVLGTRGVGLASLVSKGGTHAYGSIGFYVAFKILENLRLADQQLFALPIDALNIYLRRLSQSDFQHSSDQRADILLLRISAGSVTLSPLEIKMYGLATDDGKIGRLPEFDDSRLDEAKSQAKATSALLDSISARALESARDPHSADSVLWRNAFASLIEAAGKLSGTISSGDAVKSAISGILNSSLRVVSERGLVLFLQSRAESRTKKHFEFFESSPLTGRPDEVSVLTADLEGSFSMIKDSNSPVIERLAEFFNEKPQIEPTVESGEPTVESVEPTVESVEPTVESGEPVATEPQEVSSESDSQEDSKEESTAKEPQVGPEESVVAAEGVRFSIGASTHSREDVDFWPSNTELTHLNIGVIGNLGTGKTQFIMNLVANVAAQSREQQDEAASFLIFDYKRDYSDKDFLEQVDGKSVSPFGIPINVFELREEYSERLAYQKASSFVATLSKIYDGIGPKQGSALALVITSLFREKNGAPPSLKEVYEKYLTETKNETDSVGAILQSFVMMDIFDDDSELTVPFSRFLGHGVTSLSLNPLSTDVKLKNAIVTLMLDVYLQHMMNADKPKFVGEDPQLRKIQSYLLIDEASNIMKYSFGSLQALLTEGREFGYGVILSSQYLNDFKTSSYDYAEKMGSWMIHQVPNMKPANLISLGISSKLADRALEVPALIKHHGLWSSRQYEGFIIGTPFYKSFGK